MEHALEILKAKMQAMYGENRRIAGDYDRELAARCQNGIFVGRREEELEVWRGIPFAQQPVGKLRWRAPEPAPQSDEVYEAFYCGHSPLQAEVLEEIASLYPQGEDCLHLNIVRSAERCAEPRAVMVFIYGGAYIGGGSAAPQYSGLELVRHNPDVIYVSLNYRVNFMGFANLAQVPGAEDYGDTPNLGLLDQIAALRWVQDNIAAFGGDPQRVTIFGESAGAGSVSALMISPLAQGLFSGAICQSGTAMGFSRSAEASQEYTAKLLEFLGAHNLEELLAKEPDELRRAMVALHDIYTYPEPDGRVLPLDLAGAMRSGAGSSVRLLCGTNKDEMALWNILDGSPEGHADMMRSIVKLIFPQLPPEVLASTQAFMDSLPTDMGEIEKLDAFATYFRFHLPSIAMADMHAACGGDTFMYYFTEESTFPMLKCCHAFEMRYVFGNLSDCTFSGAPADPQLARTMQRAWVNFAKNGSPSATAAELEAEKDLEWPAYLKEMPRVMTLNSQGCRVEVGPLHERAALLAPLLSVPLQGLTR